MAATLAKPTFALEITGSEAENTMRKNVFAAAVGIQDAALSNLAQPLVRIALKLLMLLCEHRAAHAGPGVYVPPDEKFDRTLPVFDIIFPHQRLLGCYFFCDIAAYSFIPVSP